MPSAPDSTKTTTKTPSTETRVAEAKPNNRPNDTPNDKKKSASKSPPPDSRLLAAVEAVIFSADRPVSPNKLAEGLSDLEELPQEPPIDAASVADAVKALNEQYEHSARSFRIEQVAGGYRVMTLAQYAGIVGAFQKQRDAAKLSKPALETLAIIAYRQPITRADLEAIRGVSCGEVLRSLLEKRLIAITGRAEVLGRPMLYGTTRAFLDAFGLSSIKDLPQTGDQAGELSQNL